MPINPNEAPEGFVAIKQGDSACTGCHFWLNAYSCPAVPCSSTGRKDWCNVIFIRPKRVPATANWPCDDMGTPVEVQS